MVLVAHLRALWPLNHLPDFGPSGVGIFFGISGFVVTRSLLSPAMTLEDFYLRRVARIFPIYYLTLAILAATWPGRELGWCAGFVFNWLFRSGDQTYFASEAAPPVGHFWSLCVEEHFYLLWPSFVLFLPRRVSKWVPVAVILATPFVAIQLDALLTHWGLRRFDVDGLLSRITLTNFVALAVGAFAAMHEEWLLNARVVRLAGRASSLGRAAWLGAGLLALSALSWLVFHRSLPPVSGTIHQLACAAVVLLVLGVPTIGSPAWLLRVGEISYGLYLFHLPIYAALKVLDEHATAPRVALAVILTFAAAILSRALIERPIIGAARRVKGRLRWIGVGATASAVAVLVLVSIRFARATEGANRDYGIPLPLRKIETIAIGSSHARFGIAASLIPGGYNLGVEGQDLWYGTKLVEKALHDCPNLSRVIYVISPGSFRASDAAHAEIQWREAVYQYAAGIPPRSGQSLSKLLLASHEDYTKAIGRKARFIDEPDRGWVAVDASETGSLIVERAQVTANHMLHHGGPSWVEENRRLLVASIKSCKAHGDSCPLVTTPFQACFLDNLPEELRREQAEGERIVIAETGVRLFDHSHDRAFVPDDFYDCDHLNRKGGAKFTKILIDELMAAGM
jgi:peptidoglycan/LPS O-acetylase OafA/YrhL